MSSAVSSKVLRTVGLARGGVAVVVAEHAVGRVHGAVVRRLRIGLDVHDRDRSRRPPATSASAFDGKRNATNAAGVKLFGLGDVAATFAQAGSAQLRGPAERFARGRCCRRGVAARRPAAAARRPRSPDSGRAGPIGASVSTTPCACGTRRTVALLQQLHLRLQCPRTQRVGPRCRRIVVAARLQTRQRLQCTVSIASGHGKARSSQRQRVGGAAALLGRQLVMAPPRLGQ